MRVLAFASATLAALAAPAAAAELTAVGAGAVTETACHDDVHLDGVIAEVTTRQTLVGPTGGVEAVYTFALPPEAAVVGVAVTPHGEATAHGAAVDAVGAISPAPDRDTVTMSPDRALVRRLGVSPDSGDVAYELRVYPVIAAGTRVEVRWVAPLGYVDGRLRLRLPARGDATWLSDCTGSVTATAPAGARGLADLDAGGALLAAKPGKKAYAFDVGMGEVAIDVRPLLDKPVATFATAPIDAGGGAVAVAVLRPRAADAPSRFGHVVFLVDTSTSVAADAAARGAIADLVDGVAASVRSDAVIDAILFDRTATPVKGGFAAPSAETRTRLGDAIRAATPHAGTDLVGGLRAARGLLADAGGLGDPSLIVVLTDGVLPSDVTRDELAAQLADLPDGIVVSAALLAPDALPLPDPQRGPLPALCEQTGGHAIAVRVGEAHARAATVGDELGGSADWQVLGVAAGKTTLSLALPDLVPAGGGAVALGWYQGPAPKKLSLTRQNDSLALGKTKLAELAALASRSTAEPLLDDEHALAARSRAAGAVDEHTSLVAVDPTDALATARLALAARGGSFTRMPPPSEEEIDTPTAEVDAALDVGSEFEVDTAGRIRADLLVPQLLPAARRCFHATSDPGHGAVTLEIEIARGEVIAANTGSTTLSSPMLACLRDAAYALTVPSYTLTDGPDTVHQIRYPLDFRGESDVAVEGGSGNPPIDTGLDTADPLGDLAH